MLGQNMSRQGSKGARVPVKLASSQRKDGDGHFSFSVLPGLTEGFGSQRGSSSPAMHLPPPTPTTIIKKPLIPVILLLGM